jgi:adenylate cyclase
MEFFSEVFRLIGANEAVLSGVAAAIVILGVVVAAIRQLLGRSSSRSDTDTDSKTSSETTTTNASLSTKSTTVALHTDSPSIAVMPFANLSGDAEQDFLADGLTEDIIFGLSRVKQLFVIARNTCFTYKGTTPDALVVSRELGVRYVLEGSVRKAGDRVRITAQLVDAQTRTPKWAERFDRKLEEILDVDDEVTEAIVAALQPALRRAEVEHAHRASPEDLTAWSLTNRAWVSIQSDLGDTKAARNAIAACEQAVALDPDYAFAHAVLGHARSLLVNHQLPDTEDLTNLSMASIRTALELGPNDPVVRHCHAAILANVGKTDDSIREWQRAVELDPNNAGARAGLGISMIFHGSPEEGLELIDSALLRSPADPLNYHWLGNRALGLMTIGRVGEAIENARRSLDRKESRMAYAVLAGALAHEERLEEAGAAYAALNERFYGLVAEDFARMAGSLAPDEEWGKILERNMMRAAEAAATLVDQPG